jgi:hypothetical protein
VITYDLATPATVDLMLFDVAGRNVRTLELGSRASGHHSLHADIGELSPGVYFVRLTTEFGHDVRMMNVARQEERLGHHWSVTPERQDQEAILPKVSRRKTELLRVSRRQRSASVAPMSGCAFHMRSGFRLVENSDDLEALQASGRGPLDCVQFMAPKKRRSNRCEYVQPPLGEVRTTGID